MQRCFWCNLKNPKYIEYHDKEWGIENFDDDYIFQMLILESFQAGLSWECVLNKRENFRVAFDNFDYKKIAQYDENKIATLAADAGIIRNKQKISAAVNNAKVYIDLLCECGSFRNYLNKFWDGAVIYDNVSVTSELSDSIAKDLKKRGMKFLGSTVIQSFLQAIGVINAHNDNCFLYVDKKNS